MFLFWYRLSWATCHDRYSFYSGGFVTCARLSFDRKPSLRIGIQYIILAFCGCRMIIFVYFNILLGFLDYVFKEYSHFYTSPPSPAGFFTLTLNSGMSVYLFDILSFLSDQLHHKENMQNLADSYYNYVTNKVNSTNTITLKNSCYDLFNLKPIIGFKSNVITFIHTDHTIKIVSPIINIF